MDATLEHLRIGAIKGQILDADGSAVIYDLFTEFGVTQHTEIDFDLDAASPAPGVIKKKCHDIRRKIEDELGAQPYEHIHAICGADCGPMPETAASAANNDVDANTNTRHTTSTPRSMPGAAHQRLACRGRQADR
jgi:hypothetical protein